MKLSSKILIGLGIALFVIPIISTSAFVSRSTVDRAVYEEMLRKEADDPNSKDTFLKTFKINNFKNVNIIGSDSLNYLMSLRLYLIKSDQYAVKVGKDDAQSLTIKSDENGEVTIKFNYADNLINTPIYIFAPDLKQIALTKLMVNEFSAKQDELTVIGNNLSGFLINDGTTINKLNFVLKHSQFAVFKEQEYQNSQIEQQYQNSNMFIKQLNIDLDTCAVVFAKQNYESVQIKAKDSQVKFLGNNETTHLKKMNVETFGTNMLVFNDYKIDELKGKVSEQTKTDFTLSELRNLVK